MVMHPDQLEHWLQTARLGEVCCYWNGYLAWDRAYQAHAEKVAALAYRGFEAGVCTLVQRKLETARWLYFAVRI